MKKTLFILFLVVVMLMLSTVASAEGESGAQAADTSSVTSPSGGSTVETAIAICVMFVGISVIGVMFIKTIKKNK